ncbi:efflux transporter outer membrane subunit [Undibacterium sp. TS12]|uniref:efflux transporter outer membrane subunit n=1 Tax=Undibacterium sp. TS12 TaxID=2908202 RepID=UPI001F4CB95C|nr:efflux transporter outer membrane subunit [Undibacterium sp. TS12]MCH8618187.1 efflux transporter outer membrane subunit [Undibacterium sp. TS12]
MPAMKNNSVLCTLVASLMLSACASVGTPYQAPALDTPKGFSTQGKVGPVDWQHWWLSYDEPVLESLLREAYANNQDLAVAAGRVEEARANEVAARAASFPAVDAVAGTTRSRASRNNGKSSSGANQFGTDIQFGLSASYEIDFWGKLAYANQAARARLLAQEAGKNIVMNTLYASVVQAYFTMLANDDQVELAKAALATRQENLRLQRKRFSAGSIGELDLHVADSEVSAAEAILSQARQAQAISESALAILLGRSPEAIARPVILRGKKIDEIYQRTVLPGDLPSDLLNRRPDIIASEQALIAAHADLNQARSLYFPQVKLTSGLGYESSVLQDLFKPASLFWSLAGNLTQPIFRGGAIDAVVAGAKAKERQAVALYVQSVQGAFRDVHDVLVNLSAEQDVAASSERRLLALKDSLRLAEVRYSNGYSSYLEVLNAQRDLLQTQASLIATKRAYLAASINLYKAVGGTWEQANVVAVR